MVWTKFWEFTNLSADDRVDSSKSSANVVGGVVSKSKPVKVEIPPAEGDSVKNRVGEIVVAEVSNSKGLNVDEGFGGSGVSGFRGRVTGWTVASSVLEKAATLLAKVERW